MRPLTTQKRRRRRSSIHPANTLELVMKNQELINQQYRRLLEASFGRNTRRGARTASSNISRFQQPKKHLAFQSRFQRPRFNERPNNRFKLMRRGNARQTPRKKNNATQSTTELDKQLDAYMGEDVRSTRYDQYIWLLLSFS